MKAKKNGKNKEANRQNTEPKNGGWKWLERLKLIRILAMCKYIRFRETFTFKDTAHEDYSDTISKKIPHFTTRSRKWRDVRNTDKEIEFATLTIPSEKHEKNKDLKKNLLVAYEQAYKGNEWAANTRDTKRKSYYIFMGFSVSFSLLLQRVNVYNPSVENALIVYLVIVCICATWYVWVLLKKPNILAIKKKESKQEISDSENKDNFDISLNVIKGFPSLKHKDNGTPFIPSPFILAKGILALNNNDYLMTCMEVLGRKNLILRQEIAYESKVFENYFITFVSSSLLLLCWIIIWAVFIPIVQYLYYFIVEYLYPLFIQ